MKKREPNLLTALITAVASISLPLGLSAAERGTPEEAQICGGEQIYLATPLMGGEQVEICSEHQGKVILVVNTASQCMFTRQYEGLENLYQSYRDQGLVVLGFPSNDFGGQEPGSASEIADFCRINYGVQFPIFAKTPVTGENAHPLFKALYSASNSQPRWNFHKYLIDREGRVTDSFSSMTRPESGKITRAIEKLL